MMPEWLPAYCENQAVNAILSYYAQIAEKAGTALEIQADGKGNTGPGTGILRAFGKFTGKRGGRMSGKQ